MSFAFECYTVLCFYCMLQCTPQWVSILMSLAASPIPEFCHRGTHILMNILASDKEIASRVVGTQLLEIVMALARQEEPDRVAAKECAIRGLDSLVEWGLVQMTKDGRSWKKTQKAKQREQDFAKVAEEKGKEEESKIEMHKNNGGEIGDPGNVSGKQIGTCETKFHKTLQEEEKNKDERAITSDTLTPVEMAELKMSQIEMSDIDSLPEKKEAEQQDICNIENTSTKEID